jgi:predicted phosphoribosyltransferase
MYFASRLQAGRMLAAQLKPLYRYENCAVIALSDGGVMVGAQIASELHCVLTMLLSEEISLPREPVAIGGITAAGNFVLNHDYESGDLEEMTGEYRSYIEQEKLAKMHKMNELLGSSGLISPHLLRGRNIILVADGLKSPFLLTMAAEFLKPIAIEKLIIATPLASVQVVDWMHINADKIFCLDVPKDFMDTNHYYDKQDIPDHATIVKTIEQIILQWK